MCPISVFKGDKGFERWKGIQDLKSVDQLVSEWGATTWKKAVSKVRVASAGRL